MEVEDLFIIVDQIHLEEVIQVVLVAVAVIHFNQVVQEQQDRDLLEVQVIILPEVAAEAPEL